METQNPYQSPEAVDEKSAGNFNAERLLNATAVVVIFVVFAAHYVVRITFRVPLPLTAAKPVHDWLLSMVFAVQQIEYLVLVSGCVFLYFSKYRVAQAVGLGALLFGLSSLCMNLVTSEGYHSGALLRLSSFVLMVLTAWLGERWFGNATSLTPDPKKSSSGSAAS